MQLFLSYINSCCWELIFCVLLSWFCSTLTSINLSLLVQLIRLPEAPTKEGNKSWTLYKICENAGFHWLCLNSSILSLYGRIRVSENPYFCIFYAVEVLKKILKNQWWLETLREKCPDTYFFLVRIFLYSDWIQGNADQKKFRIWTLFRQRKLCL